MKLRDSIYFKISGIYRDYFCLVFLLLVLTISGISCSKEDNKTAAAGKTESKDFNISTAAREYRQIQTELILAKSEKPYLVLNLQKMYLEVHVKGVVAWKYPMNFTDSDMGDVREFAKKFLGKDDRYYRSLLDKYLFGAQEKTPDSLLAIIAPAVNVDPELMQRDLPSRFVLRWKDGVVLDVTTDIEGKATSKFKNAIMEIGQTFRRPFGETAIALKMDPIDALTLYRSTQIGMPTMIYPPLK